MSRFWRDQTIPPRIRISSAEIDDWGGTDNLRTDRHKRRQLGKQNGDVALRPRVA